MKNPEKSQAHVEQMASSGGGPGAAVKKIKDTDTKQQAQ